MGSKTTKVRKVGRKNKSKKNKTIDILVVGAAQSGKSTFFTQLQLIHVDAFADTQNEKTLTTLRSNIIRGIRELIEASDDMKSIKFDRVVGPSVSFFREKNPLSTFDRETKGHAIRLWGNRTFQKIWGARDTISAFSIPHLDYCMENIDHITNDTEPTVRDILLARKRTTGTSEISFEFNNKNFRFVDVGGQRSERRHWNQIIDKPTAVIFFAALSDWNLLTVGNKKITKTQESIAIWEEVLNMSVFQGTFFILMLNKIDVFKEKITRVDLRVEYPEYTGDAEDARVAAAYIRELYLEKRPEGKNVSVQVHITCALNTKQMSSVFKLMQEGISRQMMMNCGLMLL